MNLRGRQFIAVHEMLDGYRTEIDGRVDILAERVVQLGGFAVGRAQAVAQGSKLKAYPADLGGAAAQRADGSLLPLPGSLRGGAAGKVVGALLARGLIRKQVIDSRRKADAALNTVWRNQEDGLGVLLLITPAGLEALAIGPELADGADAPQRPGAGHTDSPDSAESRSAAAAQGRSASRTGPLRGKAREGTKQAALVAMLRRSEGATIAEIVAATDWQPHTVRGALAGALKKLLGLEVTSEKVEGRGRVYALA